VDQFEAALAGWHDFYIAAASAGAALLGLLFVGVSIGIAAVPPAERSKVLFRARQAFTNLILTLVLSLCLLIPQQHAQSVGTDLTIVAALGLAGTTTRFVQGRGWKGENARSLLGYLGSTVGTAGLLVLGLIYWTQPQADPGLLHWVLFPVFFWVSAAATASWEMLILVSRDRD
jgi:hypothetical protein